VLANGLATPLKDNPHSAKPRKLDAVIEALLISTACSEAPTRRSEWTMQLLANRLVKVGLVASALRLVWPEQKIFPHKHISYYIR
jgi:hypothetical protein